MSQKIYRSAMGKPVDMGSLLLKNENVRAVGNMGVNAKGDVINKKNDIVTSRNTQVNNQYRKQIQNQIVDVPPSPSTATKTTTEANVIEQVDTDTIEGLDTSITEVKEESNTQEETIINEVDTNTLETEKKTVTKENNSTKKTGGLASAIAKAREVEQKKLQTPREESRSKKGVKKI